MSYCDKCQVQLKVSESFQAWLEDYHPGFELHTDSNSHYRHGLRYIEVGESTKTKESPDKKTKWIKEDEYGSYCIWVRMNPKARGKHIHIDKFVHNLDGAYDHHSIILCDCKPSEVGDRLADAKEIMGKLGFEESI